MKTSKKKITVKKKPVKKIVKKSKPAPIIELLPKNRTRCSSCYEIKPISSVMIVNQEHICHKCIRGEISELKTVVKKQQKQIEKIEKVSAQKETKKDPAAKQWYAVQIYGNDEACRKKILEKAKTENLYPEFVSRVIVPKHREPVEKSTGGMKIQNKKSMPGYLLVWCQMNPNVKAMLESVEGHSVSSYREDVMNPENGLIEKGEVRISSKPFKVIRVLPFSEQYTFDQMTMPSFTAPPKPTPLKEHEVHRFAKKPSPIKPLQLGVNDRVRIVKGIYEGLPGTVKAIKDPLSEDPKLTLGVLLMGAKADIEVTTSMVEKHIPVKF